MMRRLTITLIFITIACCGGSAAAERLVVSLSNHRVAVTSSFVGEELVLFGTVEPDPATSSAAPALRSRGDRNRPARNYAHATQAARAWHLG